VTLEPICWRFRASSSWREHSRRVRPRQSIRERHKRWSIDGRRRAPGVGDHRPSIPRSTDTATPSSVVSTDSSTGAVSQPARTRTPSPISAAYSSPQQSQPIPSQEIRMQHWRSTRYDFRDAANCDNRTRLGTTDPESRGPVEKSSADLVGVTEGDGVTADRGTDGVVFSGEDLCPRELDGHSARAGSSAALREWHSPAISCSRCCRATAESSGLAHSPEVLELRSATQT